MDGLPMRKVLLRLGSDCNNKCSFCHGRNDDICNIDTSHARALIDMTAETGADMVVFSGGEPTIRPDFHSLLAHTASAGLASGVITNGRMFAYKGFAAEAAGAGCAYILMSLHGANPDVHDALTGVGNSFAQALAGLKNIIASGITDIVVNTVMTNDNIAALPQITTLLKHFAPARHKISLPEPRGGVLDRTGAVPHPRKAAAVASAIATAHAKGAFGDVVIGFDGFTPCLLQDWLWLRDDFFTNNFHLTRSPSETCFYPVDFGARAYGDTCCECSMLHLCPGIYERYFDFFPDFSPVPIHRPVSNSVLFRPAARSMDAFDGGCARDVLTDMWRHDPTRHAFVAGQGLQLYATRESETTEPELLRLKFDTRQLYATDSQETDDTKLTASLRKLTLDDCCAGCSARSLCPGVFRESGADVFAEGMAERMEILDSIRGRILEIGSGEDVTFDYFRQRLAAGDISDYTAVDPACSSEIHERHFRFLKTSAEEMALGAGEFDAVIALRSLNHMYDLSKAVANMAAHLAAGGLLVIAEDDKFAELRSGAGNATCCAHPDVSHHHYRNMPLGHFVHFLETAGMAIELIKPATPATTMCWTVVARKPV